MAEKTLTLGERILLATRLAVEEHLCQLEQENMQGDRKVQISGADQDQVTEDSLAFARGRVVFGFGDARPVEGKAA